MLGTESLYAVPLPNWWSGGYAPRKFLEIYQQILAKYSMFLPNTCVEKEFFTVVNRQDNDKKFTSVDQFL